MTTSVTAFKANCLQILRTIEETNEPVEISRQGKVRFRVIPVHGADKAPWERLRGTGELLALPAESVLSDADFNANR